MLAAIFLASSLVMRFGVARLRLEVDIRHGEVVGIADDVSRDIPRLSREAGSTALPSCAAGQQKGGKKNQESTGNDQRQRKLEERSHYQLADRGAPCHAATKELGRVLIKSRMATATWLS